MVTEEATKTEEVINKEANTSLTKKDNLAVILKQYSAVNWVSNLKTQLFCNKPVRIEAGK